MSDRDDQLIERARSGDEGAFEALYRRHRDFVVAVSSRYGSPPPDAFDVLQETFLYLLRKLPGFTLRAELRTFLYPVAKHLALKRKLSGARVVPLDPDHPDVASRRAPEPPEAGRARLEETVAALPEGQREVVLLRFADGLSLEEIAAALSIPLGTVKSRLHHALSALKKNIRPNEPFGPPAD